MAAKNQNAQSPRPRGRSEGSTQAETPAAEIRPGAADLTPDQEQTARQMLIEGATFEDVVFTLRARGQSAEQPAVENYFRSHPELHALRAQHLVEIAREIRRRTGEGDPEDVEFADAVVMTGLLRMNRSVALLDVNDALRRKYERENSRLRQQKLRLEAQHAELRRDFMRARTRLLSAQWKKARGKLKEAGDALARAEEARTLNPEIAATIQEVYGLVQAPPIPPLGAPEYEEAPAQG